ncbi:hypothetical protein BDV93DRAFT_322633 [Ceratobasidium sp. AG-I]|nr:hypothetical protein BDV93DRAFT_322633 [Ceratobasidium sp. AG-I]
MYCLDSRYTVTTIYTLICTATTTLTPSRTRFWAKLHHQQKKLAALQPNQLGPPTLPSQLTANQLRNPNPPQYPLSNLSLRRSQFEQHLRLRPLHRLGLPSPRTRQTKVRRFRPRATTMDMVPCHLRCDHMTPKSRQSPVYSPSRTRPAIFLTRTREVYKLMGMTISLMVALTNGGGANMPTALCLSRRIRVDTVEANVVDMVAALMQVVGMPEDGDSIASGRAK